MSTSSEGICQKHGIPFGLCDCGPHAWLRASASNEAFERELEEDADEPKPALEWEGGGGREWRAELKPVGFILQVFLREARDDAGRPTYGWEVMDADCSTLRLHPYTRALSLNEAFLAAENAAVELLLESLAVFPCKEPRGFGTVEIDERYHSGGPLGSFKASPGDAVALARVILREAFKKR